MQSARTCRLTPPANPTYETHWKWATDGYPNGRKNRRAMPLLARLAVHFPVNQATRNAFPAFSPHLGQNSLNLLGKKEQEGGRVRETRHIRYTPRNFYEAV